jgi:hypothetical protein
MTASRPVPRLLQRWCVQPSSDELATGARPLDASRQKGDLRTQLESPKPNREREVGDLESAEREVHGQA